MKNTGMFKELLDDFKIQINHFAEDVAPLNLDKKTLGSPVVGRYLGYKNADICFPHRFNDPYLIGLCNLYVERRSKRILNRINEITDFLLYSQFNKEGLCKYLNLKKVKWAGGFADHNFDWVDGAGYHWQKYEPHHHEDACAVYALIKSYEITSREKIIDACRLWIKKQYPRYGRFEGVYKGHKYIWQSYSPITPGIKPLAVNNVQSLVAMALSSAGYFLQNEKYLNDALSLLIYNVKDQFESGFWHYLGKEAEEVLKVERSDSKKDKRFIYNVSYMQAQIWEMLNAITYLKKGGIRIPDILMDSLIKANKFLKSVEYTRRIAKTEEKAMDDGFIHKDGDKIKLYWIV